MSKKMSAEDQSFFIPFNQKSIDVNYEKEVVKNKIDVIDNKVEKVNEEKKKENIKQLAPNKNVINLRL